MPLERYVWKCPSCSQSFAVRADIPTPRLCPECQNQSADINQTTENSAAAPSASRTSPPVQNNQQTIEKPLPPSSATTPQTESLPSEESEFPFIAYRQTDHPFLRRKYSLLQFLSSFYKVLAVVIFTLAVSTLVYSLIIILTQNYSDDQISSTMSAEMGLSLFGSGLLATCFLFTVGELIRVFIDIEENTRKH